MTSLFAGTRVHADPPPKQNLGDSAMGALGWWIFGNGFAFGNDSGGFIGTTGFALKSEGLYGTDTGDFNPLGYANWLFQWAFAASATTIGTKIFFRFSNVPNESSRQG